MQIRPYQGIDEAQVLAIWNASMTFDQISAVIFRKQVLLDSNFLRENLLVAIEDGHVVGFVLALTRQVPQFLQGLDPQNAWITAFGVHPLYQRRGIGQSLFTNIIEKLVAEGRRTLDISPYVPNYFVPGVDVDYAEATTFLEKAFDFRALDQAISMGVDLTDFSMPQELAELESKRERDDKITIRPVTSADLPDLMPFIINHFGWDWYRHAQEYLLEYFGGPQQPICVLVARLDSEVVGYCQQRGERFGPFGVRDDCRNKGIGRLLLFRCLSIMKAQHVYYALTLRSQSNRLQGI